jgi:Mce-associated membrane protein
MSDPRTPDEPALPGQPRLPAQADSAAAPATPAAPSAPQAGAEPTPEAVEDEQIASFAAEPPAERPAEPSDAVPPPAEVPAPAPEPVQPEQTTTLADEEPVHQEPAATAPVADPPVADPPVGAAPPVLAAPVPTDVGTAPAADAVPARIRRAWLPVAALGAAVALLAGGAGYLAWELRQESRAGQAREEATSAARDAARLLFSYNHETLEQDFEKGLSVTTGEFREQYQRTTKEVVTPVAEQYDAVVVAEVIEAAVVEASAEEVIALVFLNQGTTSTRVQGQQVDQSRVRMQLVREDGRWLVAGVSAL